MNKRILVGGKKRMYSYCELEIVYFVIYSRVIVVIKAERLPWNSVRLVILIHKKIKFDILHVSIRFSKMEMQKSSRAIEFSFYREK
jgi:hypothetical protein